MPTVQLTMQQRAIVAHNHGPALVFAVAGAGKTTAMAQRIRRLVQEQVFAPHQILATTFNRSAAQELRSRMATTAACAQVDIRTLHSLGGAIVTRAQQRGYLPYLKPQAFAQIETATEILLTKVLAMARSRKVSYSEELNHFDRQRFLTTLGIWKGRLAYANRSQVDLPVAAQSLANQAAPPKGFEWYLDLYRLYEEVRLQEGLLTFDDQVMTGWEVLVRHPDLLHEIQQRYHCVLVDEFQDVNLAQSELLDLITAPHRNYMVIGDDDQTIYEWRGADADFILAFEARYRAKVYLMTENFRCTAGQIVLANSVIRHNQQRRAKRLELTCGFGGVTQFERHATAEAMGRAIAEQIKQAHKQGFPLAQMAVLVRVYAQTPPVEQALMAANLPYVVEGDTPFYQRSEVQTLVDYCRLAFMEKLLLAGTRLTPEQRQQFARSWRQVYWQPKRYISRELSEKISDYVLKTYTPLTDALRLLATEARPKVAERMQQLADDLLWLVTALPGGTQSNWPAARVLAELEQRLGYRQALEEESGFVESGAAKADTITAFLDYAQGKGNLWAFLQSLRQLAVDHLPAAHADPVDRVTITTIFRAKGREWPLVVVPHCNEGFFPYKAADNLEEERRLLYVAITRSRQALYLHAVQEVALSPFLAQADYRERLLAVRDLTAAVLKGPDGWNTQDLIALARHVQPLHLQRYFLEWLDWPTAKKEQAATLLVRFFRTVAERKLFAQLQLAPDFVEPWRAMLTTKAPLPPLVLPDLGRADAVEQPSFLQRQLTKWLGPRNAIPSPTQWATGMRVRHPTYGLGTVIKVLPTLSPPVLWVRFEALDAPQRFPLESEQLQRLD
ncbi:MAG: ATP-dependent helicase [Caldilineaceae bacterium]|nr:ATP-dependent helicase [Caldilineaceae bacterium]